MVEKFLDWLRVKKKSTPYSAKLRLESLEARENPVVANYWLGVNGDFTDPQNWSYDLPEEEQDLYFVGNLGGLGGPGIPLPPGAGVNASTTFVEGAHFLPPPYAPQTHDFPSKYAGIHILDGYSGTLTMPFDIEFGSYTQESGNTSTPGTNVTVTGGLFWTGGIINTSSTAGELRLEGGPGGVIGTNASTVNSGSKIVLKQNEADIGANATIRGTLHLLNGVGIDVLTGCLLQLGDELPGSKSETISTTGTASVLVRGQVYSIGGVLSDLGVLVDGGRLTVMWGGLKVTGMAETSAVSVKMTSGEIRIWNEETLEATYGVRMEDGELRTMGVDNGMIEQTATIDGTLTVYGGSIKLGQGLIATFTTLKVTDTVKLYGGTFYTDVNVPQKALFDRIETEKTMDFTSSFKIDVTAMNGLANTDDIWWGVLYAQNGFVDENVVPEVTDPANWKTPRQSNDHKSLAVEKK